MDRRDFLKGGAVVVGLFAVGGCGVALAGPDKLLRPPGGQDETRFIGACIHCDRCISACPEDCLSYATLEDGLVNARTPVLDFHKGKCTFCGECVRVCPTDALVSPEVSGERLGVASLERAECSNCVKCVQACEYGAIAWDEANALPVIDETLCNGCGACEFVCPSASFGYYDGSRTRAIHIERGD